MRIAAQRTTKHDELSYIVQKDMIASSHNIHKTKTFSFIPSVIPKNELWTTQEKLNELREEDEDDVDDDRKNEMTSEPLLQKMHFVSAFEEVDIFKQ